MLPDFNDSIAVFNTFSKTMSDISNTLGVILPDRPKSNKKTRYELECERFNNIIDLLRILPMAKFSNTSITLQEMNFLLQWTNRTIENSNNPERYQLIALPRLERIVSELGIDIPSDPNYIMNILER